jgi:hypothetical protein
MRKFLKLRFPENYDSLSVYLDYRDKLEKLFPELEVEGFDPGFQIGYWEKYYGYDHITDTSIIKERHGRGESITFTLAHLILKSHNLHNPEIEAYE